MKQTDSGAFREDIYAHALNKFGTEPEHLWKSLPLYSVLRRSDNKKWYAIVMNIPKRSLGLSGEERVDILDIKCDAFARDILLSQKGFFPAYHLDKKNWITVLLDGSVDKEKLFGLLDASYEITKGNVNKPNRCIPTSWLVPANPKYFDVVKAFEENEIIPWKQSNSVIVGDTVYLYVAAPYSCVMYMCEVVEVNIPYEYDDGNVHMQKVMRIKRLHSYGQDEFTLANLKRCGVASVRGPRKVPRELLRKLENYK